MVKMDPTVSTLSAAGALAIAISIMLNWMATGMGQHAMSMAANAAQAADAPAVRPAWAASATGRIEPKEGEIRLTSQTPGRIVEVTAATNEKVEAGDLLVRLDDDDLWQKLEAAKSEAAVRHRERDEDIENAEKPAEKTVEKTPEKAGEKPAAAAEKDPAADRRKAEDDAAVGARALFDAKMAVDDALRAKRSGKGSADDVAAAKAKLQAAQDRADSLNAALAKIAARADMPLPTRLESSLAVARTDIAQVEEAIERARVRAPSDGTVLNVWAKAGEMAAPSPDAPLVLFGDLSGLRVRAEVEERDVVKIHVGQRVVVRADAYPDRDFEGVVTSMAPALGAPRITSRGPRRPNDVEVLEVLATLDGPPPLLTGMRVDVFFKLDSTAEAPAKTN